MPYFLDIEVRGERAPYKIDGAKRIAVLAKAEASVSINVEIREIHKLIALDAKTLVRARMQGHASELSICRARTRLRRP